MSRVVSQCPHCAHKLPLESLRWEEPTACPMCSRRFFGEVFPAFSRGIAVGEKPERVLDATEASCFFHEMNRAAQSCGSCGRFMCDLCTLSLPTGNVCPECFAAGGRLGVAVPETERSRRLWGSITLWLAFGPILAWPISAVAAPAGVVAALYGMNKPGSITGRGRWKLWLGLVCCLLISAAWAWLLVSTLEAMFQK